MFLPARVAVEAYWSAGTARAAAQSASRRPRLLLCPVTSSASSRSRLVRICGAGRPWSVARWRSIASITEWNVPAVTSFPAPSRRSRRRSSPAASRVNVSTSVCRPAAVPAAMRQATRRVSTRVLPEPAPAITATSEEGVVTATRWASSSPSIRSAWPGVGVGHLAARFESIPCHHGVHLVTMRNPGDGSPSAWRTSHPVT